MLKKEDLKKYLEDFNYSGETRTDFLTIDNKSYPKFINEYWTSKQRQSNSLHEISYRACFKAELPNFFINLLTKPGDIVYDPFAGRGTTLIEAAIKGRNIILNDINPLSKILCEPRLSPPRIGELISRVLSIPIKELKSDIDLSMFYHPDTEKEILSIKDYLTNKKLKKQEDELDLWIRMVATNRLTGHSKGFFSVYTLPPNQAISAKRQIEINKQRNQIPEYKNVVDIILKKSSDLLKDINDEITNNLKSVSEKALFLNKDSRQTKEIESNSVSLVVTSPPFLDVVQYSDDNWLRCWFNSIDANDIGNKITMCRKIEDWNKVMGETLCELYRILKPSGYIAFEVGEVRNGKINLEEEIIPLAVKNGFDCAGIMINSQDFTKTSNIWGVSNNAKGTNTNRIVLLTKN